MKSSCFTDPSQQGFKLAQSCVHTIDFRKLELPTSLPKNIGPTLFNRILKKIQP